jgi:formamidopyrimidine-DNA glycosylase
LVGSLPDKSTRVIFDLGDSKLFFNDSRKFGWVRLVPTIEIDNIDFFKKLGPEPLSADFTAQEFIKRLRKRPNSVIKAALLDQAVIAGVGNIYSDESLFAAKIHPASRINKLSDNQLKLLHKELIAVLRLSIKKGGSTDRNYVDARGKKGSFLTFAKVFRRNGLPCPRDGTIIVKSRVAGRGTHTCPHCQKIQL